MDAYCDLKGKDNYLKSDEKLYFSFKSNGEKTNLLKAQIEKIVAGNREYVVYRTNIPNSDYQLNIQYIFAHKVVSGKLTIVMAYMSMKYGGMMFGNPKSPTLFKLSPDGKASFILHDYDLRRYSEKCSVLSSFIESNSYLSTELIIQGYEILNNNCEI